MRIGTARRLMRALSPEREVSRGIIRWLRLVLTHGSITAIIVNEQRGTSEDELSRARYGAARKASGVVTGFFDATSLLPDGRVVWWEFKRPKGGVLSEAQQCVHEQACALGHVVIVANSIETARAGLHAAGVRLREAPGQATAEPVVRRAKPKVRLPADLVPF